jgi:hypothetical protein
VADLLFIAIMAAFFALAAAFVAGCERIIGAGSPYQEAEQPDTEPTESQGLVA